MATSWLHSFPTSITEHTLICTKGGGFHFPCGQADDSYCGQLRLIVNGILGERNMLYSSSAFYMSTTRHWQELLSSLASELFLTAYERHKYTLGSRTLVLCQENNLQMTTVTCTTVSGGTHAPYGVLLSFFLFKPQPSLSWLMWQRCPESPSKEIMDRW